MNAKLLCFLLIQWPSFCLPLSAAKNCHGPSISFALQSVLGYESSSEEFFKCVWQKEARIYQSSLVSDASTPEDLLANQVRMGVDGITRVLENACQSFLEPSSTDMQNTLPLVFNRQQQSLSLEELASLYGNNLFAAFLDGCSVVLNHCDRHCPNTAALCEDLQNSFPYVFANAYLTPPASQTVRAHADDRDVFVIQVHGKKKWKVYENIPVAYPYPHEQVGKNGLSVPDSVTSGPCNIDAILHPGQVLYIPRGYVHEACTYPREPYECPEPSYHITIALATFDWTWSGLLATATKQALDGIPSYRMALPLHFGTKSSEDISEQEKMNFERRIDQAMAVVRQQLSAETINTYLQQKYNYHKSRSRSARLARIRCPNDRLSGAIEASQGLSLSSLVRARSPFDPPTETVSSIRTIWDKTEPALESILDYLKLDPTNVVPISDFRVVSGACNKICDLTLLCFVRSCIERGEIIRVEEKLEDKK